jgi:hypothetical protein
MYNIPLLYRLSPDSATVSIERLRRALQALVIKHQILRTAVYFDERGVLMQRPIEMKDSVDDQELFGFTVLDGKKAGNAIMDENHHHSAFFNLNHGGVLDCHVVYRYRKSSQNETQLTGNDDIVFSIHHSAFDGASIPIFLQDLRLAYETDKPLVVDYNVLQYIDYSTYERQMDMTSSRHFWLSQLNSYDLQHRLALPVDRHRRSADERSGEASIVEFSFEDDLASSFLAYASSHHLTPFQLGLATFYTFLLKLSDGDADLCVASINANRYRSELQSLIGMFVTTLPYRIHLDPHCSFEQLVEQVREQCLSILEHSHYPLQLILADAHLQQSTAAFLETVFDFITLTPDADRLTLAGAELEPMSEQHATNVAKFDFMLTLAQNPSTMNKALSLSLVCSRDLFDQSTAEKISERFLLLLRQLFHFEIQAAVLHPLYELSVVLPDEIALMHVLSSSENNSVQEVSSTVDQLFNQRAATHPQKIAIELDEQCLTYIELFFYVQRVALHLLEKYDVQPGEIVCQCMERSLPMVSSFVMKHSYDLMLLLKFIR